MILAEIILPLAVGGTYTYRLPDDCPVNPQPGMRVLVPLGPRKIYTGIIHRILTQEPEIDSDKPFVYKPILCLLDAYPIVTPLQLKLWEWIAEYYMCTIGEVMKAALPSALKLESETRIRINPDFEASEKLSAVADSILNVLSDGKPKNLDEIAKNLQIRTAAAAVNVLLEMGAVMAEEHVEDRYVAKTEHRIGLVPDFQLPKLGPKQQQLLQAFFSLQDEAVLREGASASPTISRTLLLQRADCSIAVLKSLVEKGILSDTVVQIDRLNASAGPTRPLPELNEAQQQAFSEIKASMQQHLTTLLYGVTSSGKTEIYIRLIDEQLKVLFMSACILYS